MYKLPFHLKFKNKRGTGKQRHHSRIDPNSTLVLTPLYGWFYYPILRNCSGPEIGTYSPEMLIILSNPQELFRTRNQYLLPWIVDFTIHSSGFEIGAYSPVLLILLSINIIDVLSCPLIRIDEPSGGEIIKNFLINCFSSNRMRRDLNFQDFTWKVEKTLFH